ncbi:MAG: hypothetical protein RLZZ459_43, partial [Cyanobacteriota bacterium]
MSTTQSALPVAMVQLCATEDAALNQRQAEVWLERAVQEAPGGVRPRLLML